MPATSSKTKLSVDTSDVVQLPVEPSPRGQSIDPFLPPDWCSQLIIGTCAALVFATFGRFVDGPAGRFVFQILGCAGAIHATGLLHLESYWANPKYLHSALFGTTLFGSLLGHFASEIILSEGSAGELMRCFVVR